MSRLRCRVSTVAYVMNPDTFGRALCGPARADPAGHGSRSSNQIAAYMNSTTTTPPRMWIANPGSNCHPQPLHTGRLSGGAGLGGSAIGLTWSPYETLSV